MALSRVEISVKPSISDSNISAKIQVKRGRDRQIVSNVLSAQFVLNSQRNYKLWVEVRGDPETKYEVKVSGAKSAKHRKGEIKLPLVGWDIIRGDIEV